MMNTNGLPWVDFRKAPALLIAINSCEPVAGNNLRGRLGAVGGTFLEASLAGLQSFVDVINHMRPIIFRAKGVINPAFAGLFS